MKIFFSAFLAILCFSASAQNSPAGDLAPGYYVVIASYGAAQIDYANAYTSKINEQGHHARFGLDAVRKYQYVYLDYYTDFNESVRQMLKARKEGFETAWVRVKKGEITVEKVNVQTANNAMKPVMTPAQNKPVTKEEKVPAVSKEENTVIVKKDPEVIVPAKEEVHEMPTAATTQQPATTRPVETIQSQPVVVEIPNTDPFVHPALLSGSTVLLTLYNPTTNVEVEGDVEIVDTERSKLIVKAKGNDYAVLPDPKSKSEKLTLISSAFGFRKVQHELNYKSNEKDSLPPFMDVLNNHYRIRFDMIKLQRGDIAVLYNVYFYNDAAVMIPESKYELNKLLQMLNDNPDYKITLHGHTNGNSHGKIITMGKSKDFFTLNSDVKTGIGSAKELSRARAQVIKDWLISNGVAADRMAVEAHGGKRMIHDKNSANAKRNVRVEVEITN